MTEREPVSAFDESCDYCGRRVGMKHLRQIHRSHTTSWLCDACFDRQQAQHAAMTAAERGQVSA